MSEQFTGFKGLLLWFSDPCVPNPCHVGFTCLVESGVAYCLGPQETTSPTPNPPKTTQSPRGKNLRIPRSIFDVKLYYCFF